MVVIFWAFSLFHLCVGVASLGLGVRLLTPEERHMWRSKAALATATALCWLFPAATLGSVWVAWRAFDAGEPLAFPLLLTPILWLLLMGIVFALVDFFEDGVLGNARDPEG